MKDSPSEGVYTILFEGAVDVLFQPRELSGYAAAVEGALFQPEIKGPWD